MLKGKFKYTLKGDKQITEYEGECIYYDDRKILIYKEQNGTDVFIDFVNLILTRENDEMFLVLNFFGGESYINMKKMNSKMPLSLVVKSKQIEANKLIVSYVLSEQNEFDFSLEWIF